MNEDKPSVMPPVPPFVRFVASAVPMVFDDSLSYYEALCALWKYVSDMTDVINNNATLEEEYILKFNELKSYVENYFANLDVQEEINNKLDAMVEDGTLQTLINNFLQPNVTWTFDTVGDMQSSTNLVDGGFARTMGFHSLNDGGAALYSISDSGTANGLNVLACGDLFATLIVPCSIAPEMVGAYGDATQDDTDAFSKACELSKHVKGNGQYKIDSITLHDIKVECDIKTAEAGGLTFTNNVDFSGKVENGTTSTLSDGGRCIYVTGSNNIIHDAEFTGLYTGVAIVIETGANHNKVINSLFEPCFKIDVNIAGNDTIVEGCYFAEHTNSTVSDLTDYSNAIKISQYLDLSGSNGEFAVIKNNTMLEHGDNAIDAYTGGKNIVIDGNYIYTPSHESIEIKCENNNEYNVNHIITNNTIVGARCIYMGNTSAGNVDKFTISNNYLETTTAGCIIIYDLFDITIQGCQFKGVGTGSYAFDISKQAGTTDLPKIIVGNSTFSNFYNVINEGKNDYMMSMDNIVAHDINRFTRVLANVTLFINNANITTTVDSFGNVAGKLFLSNSVLKNTYSCVINNSTAQVSAVNCKFISSSQVFNRTTSSIAAKYAIVACDYSESNSLSNFSATPSVDFTTMS